MAASLLVGPPEITFFIDQPILDDFTPKEPYAVFNAEEHIDIIAELRQGRSASSSRNSSRRSSPEDSHREVAARYGSTQQRQGSSREREDSTGSNDKMEDSAVMASATPTWYFTVLASAPKQFIIRKKEGIVRTGQSLKVSISLKKKLSRIPDLESRFLVTVKELPLALAATITDDEAGYKICRSSTWRGRNLDLLQSKAAVITCKIRNEAPAVAGIREREELLAEMVTAKEMAVKRAKWELQRLLHDNEERTKTVERMERRLKELGMLTRTKSEEKALRSKNRVRQAMQPVIDILVVVFSVLKFVFVRIHWMQLASLLILLSSTALLAINLDASETHRPPRW